MKRIAQFFLRPVARVLAKLRLALARGIRLVAAKVDAPEAAVVDAPEASSLSA